MGKILGIGIPIAFQDGLIQVAFIIITIIANQRGLNDAAAVGIVEKVISFLFLVPSSMLSTVSALGAQKYRCGQTGAGHSNAALCGDARRRLWRACFYRDPVYSGRHRFAVH